MSKGFFPLVEMPILAFPLTELFLEIVIVAFEIITTFGAIIPLVMET
jgi:hypothetical protein